MTAPYYSDDAVVLFHGDCREVLEREQKRKNARHRGEYGDVMYVDDGTRQQTSVIEAPSVRFRKRHQDEKPLAVVEPLVRECTPPGGTVLDPFAGSGTTGIAARMLGRQAVLIEADEAMCEIAAKRLDEPDLFTEVIA